MMTAVPPARASRARIFSRNIVISFGGQIIPMVAAFCTIPLLLRTLGTDRFGLLSLLWVIIGYFAIFDFGLGRATTKFTAELMGTRIPQRERTHFFWTSFILQAGFGIIAALTLTVLTHAGLPQLFNIPSGLLAEARLSFYALAVVLPVVILVKNIRALLEAVQRFDLVNIVSVPLQVLTYLLPLTAAWKGTSLAWIIILLGACYLIGGAFYFFFALRVLPELKETITFSAKAASKLLSFGIWVTIANIIIPVIVYLDRIVISVLLSTSALPNYTVPYDVVTRFSIFTRSFIIVLFPVMSSMHNPGSDTLEKLYRTSAQFFIRYAAPFFILLAFFGHDLLSAWINPSFARQSALAIRFLCIGVLFSSGAQIPATLFDSIGRPDIRSKIMLSYIIPYAVLMVLFVKRWGIHGAALAWMLRAVLEYLICSLAAAAVLRNNRTSPLPATATGKDFFLPATITIVTGVLWPLSPLLSYHVTLIGSAGIICLLLLGKNIRALY